MPGLRSLVDGRAYAVLASTVALTTAAAMVTYQQLSANAAVAATVLEPSWTVRGLYLVQAPRPAAVGGTIIDFGRSLNTAPAVEVTGNGTPTGPHCPGTLADPQAAPGYLCVYRGAETGAAAVAVRRAGGASGADPIGALLWVIPADDARGPVSATGSWAVSGR